MLCCLDALYIKLYASLKLSVVKIVDWWWLEIGYNHFVFIIYKNLSNKRLLKMPFTSVNERMVQHLSEKGLNNAINVNKVENERKNRGFRPFPSTWMLLYSWRKPLCWLKAPVFFHFSSSFTVCGSLKAFCR